MLTLMKSTTVDDSEEVQDAFRAWQQARTHLEQTTSRVQHLKRLLHPDYGLPTDEIQQVEAQAELPEALRNHAQGMRDEKAARAQYEASRKAAMITRGKPLQEKLGAALKERESAMSAVVLADQKVRDIYDEAVATLGQSQTVIPNDLGLPWLTPSNGPGTESWWDYLLTYYDRQVQGEGVRGLG